jgi:hypothetical protein
VRPAHAVILGRRCMTPDRVPTHQRPPLRV